MNFLAISIGNTRTCLGTFVDDKLVATEHLDNARPGDFANEFERAYHLLENRTDVVALLASVSPPIAKHVKTVISELPVQLLRVDEDVPIPIGRRLDPEAIVGQDRLLNAAAAYDTLKQACAVVDAGSAITVDFIDGSGTFHGGAIAPGAQMMLDSLHEYTALLPEVELARPQEPIGHNTNQGVLAGVFYGLRGMVRELVECYAEEVGAYPVVIATGGNAQLLFENYDLVERIVPDLTLRGLAAALRCAIRSAEE